MAAHPVTRLQRELARICADLRALSHRFAIAGGLAVSARAEPRLTRDVDLAVSVESDANAETLVLALQQRGYQVVASVEQTETGRLATVRLMHEPERDIVVDLLFASCGIEPEVVDAATVREVFPGLYVPVACVGDLIAMKLLSRDDRRRPADADDLKALREIAEPQDWVRAEWAVTEIEARQTNRDRDLRAALQHLRDHGAY